MIRMNYDDWVEAYQPIKNPNADYGYNGTMFETFDPDLRMVKDALGTEPARRVWTLLEEDGHQWISPGYSLVNRLGYFITTVAAPEREDIEVDLDDDDDLYGDFRLNVVDASTVQIIDEAHGLELCTVSSYHTDQGYVADHLARARGIAKCLYEAGFEWDPQYGDVQSSEADSDRAPGEIQPAEQASEAGSEG